MTDFLSTFLLVFSSIVASGALFVSLCQRLLIHNSTWPTYLFVAALWLGLTALLLRAILRRFG